MNPYEVRQKIRAPEAEKPTVSDYERIVERLRKELEEKDREIERLKQHIIIVLSHEGAVKPN